MAATVRFVAIQDSGDSAKFEVKPSRNYNADADAPATDSKKSKKPLIQEVEDTPMADAESEEEEEESEEKAGDESEEEVRDVFIIILLISHLSLV